MSHYPEQTELIDGILAAVDTDTLKGQMLYHADDGGLDYIDFRTELDGIEFTIEVNRCAVDSAES